MNWVALIFLFLVMVCPLAIFLFKARWVRVLAASLLLMVGFFNCVFLFGIVGRLIVRGSDLVGDELQVFVSGVWAYHDETVFLQLLSMAVILSLFVMVVLSVLRNK